MKNAQTAHEQKFEMVFRKEKDLDLANQMLERIFHAPIHRMSVLITRIFQDLIMSVAWLSLKMETR